MGVFETQNLKWQNGTIVSHCCMHPTLTLSCVVTFHLFDILCFERVPKNSLVCLTQQCTVEAIKCKVEIESWSTLFISQNIKYRQFCAQKHDSMSPHMTTCHHTHMTWTWHEHTQAHTIYTTYRQATHWPAHFTYTSQQHTTPQLLGLQ